METFADIIAWVAAFCQTYPVLAVVLTPVVGYLIPLVAAKTGNTGLLIMEIRKAVKDGKVEDIEAAVIFWRFIAIWYGWWPNESRKVILKYAPAHQQVILLGEKTK